MKLLTTISLVLLMLPSLVCACTPEQEILDMVNGARAGANLKPLTVNTQLQKAALLKAKDMAKYDYFSHTSPTGAGIWKFVRKYGSVNSFTVIGDNLGAGFQRNGKLIPIYLFEDWMKSPTHKANILDTDYTETGIGIYGKYTVQIFANLK